MGGQGDPAEGDGQRLVARGADKFPHMRQETNETRCVTSRLFDQSESAGQAVVLGEVRPGAS
ncbi:hypothetical protein HerbRD11066_12920 [Herbidospora sp. RD11066]